MAKNIKLIFLFIFLINATQVLADIHHELKSYYKCYSIMTQTRPSLTDINIKQIRNGKITSTQACMNVLNSASLDKNDSLHQPDKNLLGQKVLRTFQAFHNTWFADYMTYMIGDSPILLDIVELEEPAFFLTRSLFKKEMRYKDILSGSDSYRGKRFSKEKPHFLIGTSRHEKYQVRQKYKVPYAENKFKDWSPTHLERGALYGIEKNKANQDILTGHSNHIFFPIFNDKPVDIHRSLGGGFMGLNSYVLFNNGRPHGELSDGQVVMMRGYSKNLIRDIMCRDLPVISQKDAVAFITRTPKVSWSHGKTCMSCHATMDTMVGLLRNAELIINDEPEHGSSHMKYHKDIVSVPKNYQLFQKQKNFHLTKAEGRLVYRNILDQFTNVHVSSFDALGIELSKNYDFYACAVSRYFYFLTGTKIKLTDLTNKSMQSQFIHKLSMKLSKNQQTHEIIRDIIDSDWFK
jgi:hypothetical protein